MEYIFENEYKCTKKYYRDFYGKMFFGKTILKIINFIIVANLLIHLLFIMFPQLGRRRI